LVLLSGAVWAAPLHLHEAGFAAGPDGMLEGWTVWSPRAEIAPRTFLDPVRTRVKPASLAISGNANAAEFGGWQRVVNGIDAGAWSRFRAY